MLPVLSSRWKTFASAVAVLTALGAPASAQQASPGTVHVTGVVTDAQAATPLRHARVTPVTTTSLASASFTDDNGRFSGRVETGSGDHRSRRGRDRRTFAGRAGGGVGNGVPRQAGQRPADQRPRRVQGERPE